VSSSPKQLDMPVPGTVYIETYGCQMNEVDTEIVFALLEEHGYHRVDDPEVAEIVLVNTCAVREHAEVKAISNINHFGKLKSGGRAARVGVLGCLSQHAAQEIKSQLPFLDWILGPDVYRSLPSLLALDGECEPRILTEAPKDELYDEVLPSRREGINAWITISRGCNNFCAYCVVPKARGRERHRPAGSIIAEAQEAVDSGFVQVTLLGQNVNSYSHENTAFPELLAQVAEVPGLKRLRYMTSHPKDCSEELLRVMADHETICPELHLPFQAGSDSILKAMGRKYTADKYRRLVEMAREIVPDLLLSTDIIVGFPGETDEDYLKTEELVRDIGYDNAFVYRYSVRPGTRAALNYVDDVPIEVKTDRLMRINDIVQASGKSRRLAQVGRTVEVLVEKPSTRDPNESLGRTHPGHMVVVPGVFDPGTIVTATLDELSGITLRGTVI
jgi:tRNA-2-methylthio-N6-dimethylallyladenosine synthase